VTLRLCASACWLGICTSCDCGYQTSIGARCFLNWGVVSLDVVGAGAVVVRDLPANVVAVGNPARVIRTIDG